MLYIYICYPLSTFFLAIIVLVVVMVAVEHSVLLGIFHMRIESHANAGSRNRPDHQDLPTLSLLKRPSGRLPRVFTSYTLKGKTFLN